MTDTLIIVGTSVVLSLLVLLLSRWTGLGERFSNSVRRAALDATLGKCPQGANTYGPNYNEPPEPPTSDAVILVEVPRIHGAEDPRLIQELHELSRQLHEEESND